MNVTYSYFLPENVSSDSDDNDDKSEEENERVGSLLPQEHCKCGMIALHGLIYFRGVRYSGSILYSIYSKVSLSCVCYAMSAVIESV